jgi:hypothetical protein
MVTIIDNRSKPFRYAWVLLFGVTLGLAVEACQRVSPAEEKVIGIWEFTGLDATGRVVFRRDHTVVDLFTESDSPNARWAPTAWGKWRLEGNEIITDDEVLPIPGYSPRPRRVTRIPIRDFEEGRLVRADGRADFNRVRVGIEQYLQILALAYVIASLIALSAFVYAIRNSSFRKEFVVLAVAAVLTVVWSTSMLIAELAQTGTVIISAVSLRSLWLPREILRVVCILIFTIGFVRLAFAVRVRASAKETTSDA